MTTALPVPVHDNDAEVRCRQEMQGWKDFLDGYKEAPPKKKLPISYHKDIIEPGRRMMIRLTPNQCKGPCPVPVEDKDKSIESQRPRPVQLRKWVLENSKDTIEPERGATK